jgi:tetratricopeptide (TPR) repeat protein
MIIQRFSLNFSDRKSIRAMDILMLVTCLALSLLLLADSPARAQSSASDSDTIRFINDSIKKLEDGVVAKKVAFDELKKRYDSRVETREVEVLISQYKKAKEIYLGGKDYDLCTEILYPIIEGSVLSQVSPEYREAEILLANSLFYSKRYDEARLYYNRIIQRGIGESNPYYLVALEKLLDISIKEAMKLDFYGQKASEQEKIRQKMDRLKEFDQLYNFYLQFRPDDNSIKSMNYLLGKRYFFLGQYEKASSYFEQVPQESPHFLKARYFLGVIAVAAGNYKEALPIFEDVIKQIEVLPNVTEPDQEIKDEASLNIGRIYYELGDYDSAIPAYSAIPATASNYTQALFELIHVYYEINFQNVQKLDANKTANMSIDQAFRAIQRKMNETSDPALVEKMKVEEDELKKSIAAVNEKEEGLKQEVENVKARAFNIYKELQEIDPNSPLISEAEIRIGKLYLDAKDFQMAEDWNNTVTQKYKDFGKTIRQVEQSPAQDGGGIFQQLLDTNQEALSPELISWIKKDKNVSRGIKVLDGIEEQKKLIQEIISLYDEVGKDLINLKQKEFLPIFAEAEEGATSIQGEVGDDRKIATMVNQKVKANAANLGLNSDAEVKVRARIEGINYDLTNLNDQLAKFLLDIKETKKRRVASLEQSLESQKADFEGIYRKVEGWENTVKNKTGVITLANLRNIKREINKLASKASMGIIDISWQKNTEKSEEIKRLQLQRNQEIVDLQKQLDGGTVSPVTAPVAPESTNPTPEEDQKKTKSETKEEGQNNQPPPASEDTAKQPAEGKQPTQSEEDKE